MLESLKNFEKPAYKRTHLAPETPPPPPPKPPENKGENRMEILIDRKKLFIAMARKNMNIPELSEKAMFR